MRCSPASASIPACSPLGNSSHSPSYFEGLTVQHTIQYVQKPYSAYMYVFALRYGEPGMHSGI